MIIAFVFYFSNNAQIISDGYFISKDLVWNCQTPAILWFSRIDRDPRLLSPTHVVPLKNQKNMPDPMGEGLARDEAMNHGQ